MERLSTSAAAQNFSTLRRLVDKDGVVLLSTHTYLRYVIMDKDIFIQMKELVEAYWLTNKDYLDETALAKLNELLSKIID